MTKRRKLDSDFLPVIRRGRIGTLVVYDVSESELQILENGAPDSIFLNLAIFLFSTAVVLLISLLTASIESNRVFYVFVICTVCGFVGSFILLSMWLRSRQSISMLVKQIRGRMLPENDSPDDSETEESA